MNEPIVLGGNDAGPLSIDLPAFIESRCLINANSGAGKSWAIRRLLEVTHGHVQQIVLDLEGEFPTLREHFDYVIAGKGGDTPAEPKSAKLLARKLLEMGVSAICDLSELPAHERVRFVRFFLEALVAAPRSAWHSVMVVVDEAHHFCPEKGQAESAATVIDLCTRGRKRGLCPVLATQRLSKLHKDAVAELLNVLVGRTGLDIDQQRAGDILGFISKAERVALRDLEPGEFYAFGPAISRSPTLFKVSEVQSRHPRVGERGLVAPPPPTEEMRAILAQLADLPGEAEAEAKTIESLTRDLLTTRRELTIAQKRTEPEPCNHEPIIEQLTSAAEMARAEADDLVARITRAQEALGWPEGIEREPIRPVTAQPQPKAPPRTAPTTAPKVPEKVAIEGDGSLTGPEKRILDAIAWLEALGIQEPEQPAVAFLAGYTYGGGAFNNPRGRLRVRGLVEYAGERIRLTDEGRSLADAPDGSPSNEELHARVMARLPGPERRLLQPLLDAYPEPMTDADLAAAAGYTAGAGAFNNPKGRLRSLGLIDYPMPRHAVARPLLFPEQM